MRLIDVDALKEKEQYIPCGNGLLFHGVTAGTIDAMPTIDTETLPVVRELREELQRVTVERDAAVADCFKFMDSKGLVSVLVKNEKGQKVSRAIWFFEYEGWIGLIRRE